MLAINTFKTVAVLTNQGLSYFIGRWLANTAGHEHWEDKL